MCPLCLSAGTNDIKVVALTAPVAVSLFRITDASALLRSTRSFQVVPLFCRLPAFTTAAEFVGIQVAPRGVCVQTLAELLQRMSDSQLSLTALTLARSNWRAAQTVVIAAIQARCGAASSGPVGSAGSKLVNYKRQLEHPPSPGQIMTSSILLTASSTTSITTRAASDTTQAKPHAGTSTPANARHSSGGRPKLQVGEVLVVGFHSEGSSSSEPCSNARDGFGCRKPRIGGSVTASGTGVGRLIQTELATIGCGVEVGLSRYHGAGFGLVASRIGGFKAGQPITEYDGELRVWSDCCALRDAIGPGHFRSLGFGFWVIAGITGADVSVSWGRGGASLANDGGFHAPDGDIESGVADYNPRNASQYNAKYVISEDKSLVAMSTRKGPNLSTICYLEATRDIAADEEISVPYAKGYWTELAKWIKDNRKADTRMPLTRILAGTTSSCKCGAAQPVDWKRRSHVTRSTIISACTCKY